MSGSASSSRRLAVPLRMFLREYYRNSLNLVLLVVIPLLLILAFGSALNRITILLRQNLSPVSGQAMGALWAAAFLTGITGLFSMLGAREADRRLVRAGYGALELIGLRFIAVALLAVIATAVSFAVLRSQVEPEQPVQALAVMYAGALVYGALGILIGSLVGAELEGSFALLFFFVMDSFIGSPLSGSTTPAFVLLPIHYPTTILLAAVDGQAHSNLHWLHVGAYVVVTSSLAAWAFHRVARPR